MKKEKKTVVKKYGKVINKVPCLIIGKEIIPILDYVKKGGEKNG